MSPEARRATLRIDPGLPSTRMMLVCGAIPRATRPRSATRSGCAGVPPTTVWAICSASVSSPVTTPSASSCWSSIRATVCTRLALRSRSETIGTVRWAARRRAGSSSTCVSGTSDDCTDTSPTPGSPESAGRNVYCAIS